MATTLQLRRGNTAAASEFTGASGEVFIDTTKNTVLVHDGSTQGGHELALASDVNTKLGATINVARGGTGATTLTAGSVVIGNGSDPVNLVTPGTTGNVLTSNGTTWVSSAPATSAGGGSSGFTTRERTTYVTPASSYTIPTWTTTTGTTSQAWIDIKIASANKDVITAIYQSSAYVSTNGGTSWTAVTVASGYTLSGLTMSANGAIQYVTTTSGSIYKSTNSGSTWTSLTGAGTKTWRGIFTSSDGTKVIAVVNNGQIWVSTDSGSTWAAKSVSSAWSKVCGSSDFSVLYAIKNPGIYKSTDGGNTWNLISGITSTYYYGSLDCSTDGLTVLVGRSDANSPSRIYTSLDGGTTWSTANLTSSNFGHSFSATSFSISSDKNKIMAGFNSMAPMLSTDGGLTWWAMTGGISYISSLLSKCIAIAPDGSYALFSNDNKPIYKGALTSATLPSRIGINTSTPYAPLTILGNGIPKDGGSGLDAPALLVYGSDDLQSYPVPVLAVYTTGIKASNITVSNQATIESAKITAFYDSVGASGVAGQYLGRQSSGTAWKAFPAQNLSINTAGSYFDGFYSSDWITTDGSDPANTVKSGALSADGSYALIVSNSGRLFTSTSASKLYTWVANSTYLYDKAWWCGAVSTTGQFMMAVGDNYIAKSNDYGSTFTLATSPSVGGYYTRVVFSDNASTIYVVDSQAQSVFKSTDLGSTWTNVSPPTSTGWIVSIGCSSDGTIVYIARGSEIYKSTNSGSTWTNLGALSGIFSGTGVTYAYSDVAAISVSSDGQRITAVSSYGPILYTADGGTTWNVGAGADGSVLYVSGAANSISISGNGKIQHMSYNWGSSYRSNDYGATWIQDSTDIPHQGGVTVSKDGLVVLDAVNYYNFKVKFNTPARFGVGLSNPTYQLQVGTDSAAKPATSTWTISSDERLKENISLANLERCYEIVKTVPLKHYTWKDSVYSVEEVRDRSKLGWIANDVQAVFPKATEVISQPLLTTHTENVVYREQEVSAEEVDEIVKVVRYIDGVATELEETITKIVATPLFDETPVVDSEGNPVLDENGVQKVHKIPRMVEKTKQVIVQDSIDDCLSLNSDQMYAAMYGALQKVIEKIESLEQQLANLPK